MNIKQRKIAVLGSGSWGTALANHLSIAGHEVVLWAREPSIVEEIKNKSTNSRYFGALPLSPRIIASSEISESVREAELVVISVPSKAVREVSKKIAPHLNDSAVIVSTAKGLEQKTGQRMSEVLGEVLKNEVAVLSGPSFALEVAQGKPTAVTMASANIETAKSAGEAFHFGNFRIYSSDDVVGVELGGVLKNILAVAAGIIDGRGFGMNARAALLTRGLPEMMRLAVEYGAKPQTLMGLSGLGDLLLTATGELSRNRQVGLRLGRGEKLENIISDLGQVAEGVTATSIAVKLAKDKNISIPIITEVDRVLSGTATIDEAVKALFARNPKVE